MTVAIQLQCDLTGGGCQKATPVTVAHGPATIGVAMTKLLRMAQDRGWGRIRGKGWACPSCLHEWHLARPTMADVVSLDAVRKQR